VHTQLGAQRLARRLRVRAERLSVIPHGVIGLPTKPLPPLEPLRLMYFGFIHKGKGIEDLIDAVGRLRAKHPDLAGRVRLCIAGGSAPDVPQLSGRAYLQSLRARVERRGLATQVDWELDIDERDLPDLIQRHHLVVLPHREPRRFWGRACGSSGALAWALACGRGVITSNARAFPEEVGNGIGATYPKGDVGALTQQLVLAASEPDLLRRWAEQAAALALKRAWPTTGQRFAGHFQRTLERTPRQHSV
jgi:glycosyltransferase involved in cell wall biosynthesis